MELEAGELRQFEQKSPYGNLYQMAERAEVRRRMGWQAWLFGVKDAEKVLAACVAFEKDGMMMVPMGGVMDWGDLRLVKFWLDGLIAEAKRRKAVTLEVFPPLLLSKRDVHGEVLENYARDDIFSLFASAGFEYEGRTTAIENKANRWVTVKDLSGFSSAEELQASYKKNVRNKLRKCSKELDILEVHNEAGLAEVAEAIEGSNTKNGVRSRDLSYYRYIADAFGKQVHFMLARNKANGDAVAGRVIFEHPNETVSFISGTVQKYRRMNAMTVLQDDLLRKSLAKGVKRVNFYGMAGDFSKNNHLLEFKSGFGVQVEEYIGGFRLIIDRKKYRQQQLKRGIRRVGGAGKRAVKTVLKKAGSRK